MIPNINVWSVDSDYIILVWKVQDRDTIKSYNLYGCATSGGVYTLVEGSVPNVAHPMSPNSVMVKISRSSISLAADAPYFFKITSVDMSGVESNIASSEFISVDALDDVFRNRWTDDNSPVYKSVTIALTHATTNYEYDVVQLLGRQANYLRIETSHSVSLRINSTSNDSVLVSDKHPFIPDRGAISVSKLFFSTVGGNATINVFISGN
jgi:hypothetical protein